MTRVPKLTAEERKRFEDVAWQVYNAIACDAWGERIPGKAEFVSVISDQMLHDHGTRHCPALTPGECERWCGLPTATIKAVCLAVGP